MTADTIILTIAIAILAGQIAALWAALRHHRATTDARLAEHRDAIARHIAAELNRAARWSR